MKFGAVHVLGKLGSNCLTAYCLTAYCLTAYCLTAYCFCREENARKAIFDVKTSLVSIEYGVYGCES
jgi:hypothetical protein